MSASTARSAWRRVNGAADSLTYCLGILLKTGLVLAADARSNAGVDQVARVRKLNVMKTGPDRLIVMLSAGNLATTQAIVTTLMEAPSVGDQVRDISKARTMFEVATIVGATLRDIVGRDGHYVEPYGDPSASFIVAGQIAGDDPRLFEVYSAGNFIEASSRSNFLQIGETKYGKPILDRALRFESPMDEAAKLALLSFDATIRSNLSVGLPIDILRYEAGSYAASDLVTIEEHNPYWRELRRMYSDGLTALVMGLAPLPPADQMKETG